MGPIRRAVSWRRRFCDAVIQPQIEARAAQFGGDRTSAIRDLLKEKQPNLMLLPPERIGEARHDQQLRAIT
ncbi:hypothetical protein ABIF73_000789 [Bradyrhizobium japonicum]|uniref:hypothetical protein n=1 Tax=Bradyrhizobium japonicum TaxID=375 RepID=UPI003398CD97